MLIRVEPNEFCQEVVAQFRETGPAREARRVKASPPADGPSVWCRVDGWGPEGAGPAQAIPVEDSGGGTMCLVRGGSWGVRLTPEGGG
ncbi:MAG: hypothetical protein AAB368_05375, partial [bacterium]